MLPSASLGAAAANGHRALYETIHGSAPDVAGQGIANPLGSILSFAMYLTHSFGMPQEARLLEPTVERVVDAGVRTADIAAAGAPSVSTAQMGDTALAVLERAQPASA